MQIHKLIIKETKPVEVVKREIKFNSEGLNLIVDNTKNNSDESGNSVGKTTAVKIIDLCLGAKSVRELYYDPDTKSENVIIKDYLTTSKVQAELILKHEEMYFSIKRDLFKNGKRYFDNEIYPIEDFNNKVKYLLFHLNEQYPTLRQLIPKFVRVSNVSEERMIKYLPMMTTNNAYDTIYSFLFQVLGADFISERNSLNEELSLCNKSIALLKSNTNIISINSIEQKLALIEESIKELVAKRTQLSYIEEYKTELSEKRDISIRLANLQQSSEFLKLEIDIIEQNLLKLNEDKSKIDMKLLEKIYTESAVFIPVMQKTFQDLVDFHDNMIENRSVFISNQLEMKKIQYNECIQEIEGFIVEKREILSNILDEGLLDDLNDLNSRIENLSVQKGELIQSQKLLVEQENLQKSLQERIDEIDAQTNTNTITNKITVFNKKFSDYSNKLYGEKYYITFNPDWKNEKNSFPITVESMAGVLGTGKKKGMIAAMDFAYMEYAKEFNIIAPNFVIHDKLENTHINQLNTIFSIATNLSGQYILPILRERIDNISLDKLSDYIILELSEENKFFKI